MDDFIHIGTYRRADSSQKTAQSATFFKVPGGKLFPIIGIIGTVYMVLNISSDPTERNQIWLVTAVVFLILAIYSFFWIKYKMKMKVFKSVPLEKVMAMESDAYYLARKQRGLWR